jgi:hypothetical protein
MTTRISPPIDSSVAILAAEFHEPPPAGKPVAMRVVPANAIG